MKTRRAGAAIVLCVAFAFAVVGCSAPAAAPAPTPAQNGVSELVRKAMKDGKVTYDEYHDGYERYAACMRKAGYPLVEKGMDRSLIDYAVPSEAVDKGVDKRCYDREFGPLDDAWQLAHVETSESTEILRQCLVKAGIKPGKTRADVDKQIDDNHIDLVACLEKG